MDKKPKNRQNDDSGRKVIRGNKKGITMSGRNSKEISEAQQDVLNKYLAGLTINQISAVTKRSRVAIYKAIRKLKEKGYIKGVTEGYKKVKVVTHVTTFSKFRLHSCQFIINIIARRPNYKNLIGKTDRVDGHYIKFNQDTIEVYQERGKHHPASIYANSIAELQSIAGEYWFSFFYKLQKLYFLTLVQEGRPSIKEAKSHIADTDNPASKDIILNYGNGLYLYDIDGKAFMVFDMSHKEPEAEYIKPKENWNDAKKINPFFVDLKHNDWDAPSTTKARIDKIEELLYQTAEKLFETNKEVNLVAANASTHFPLLIDMKRTLAKLEKKVKTNEVQRSLRGYE